MGLFKLFERMILNYSHRDKGIMFSENEDAKMEEAIKSARESLPEFLSHLSTPNEKMENFAVKVGLKTKDGTLEHCWVSDLCYEDEKIRGKLSVEPNNVAGYELGSEITIDMNEISDWAYSIEGKYEGHYTTRCLLPQMPGKMRKQVMEIYGWL